MTGIGIKELDLLNMEEVESEIKSLSTSTEDHDLKIILINRYIRLIRKYNPHFNGSTNEVLNLIAARRALQLGSKDQNKLYQNDIYWNVAKKINPNFETIFNSLRDKLKVFSTSFFNNLKNKCGTLATITLFNNYIEVKDNMSLSFKLNDRFLNFKLTSCIRDTKFNSTIRLYNLLKGESLFPNGCEISYETRTGVTSCNCTLSNQIESIFTCRMKIHQRAKPLNLQIFQVENPEADSF